MGRSKRMLLFVALLRLVLSPACPGETAAGEPKERIVHFPKDWSIGRLYLMDKRLPAGPPWGSLSGLEMKSTPWGEAKGEARVPTDKMLRLDAWRAGRSLADLKPDDIQFLTLSDVDDSALSDVGHLTGLVGLCIWGNDEIHGPGLRHLTGLTRLKYLWLPGHIRSTDLAHFGKLACLEYLYFGGVMVTDAKMAGVARITLLKRLDLPRSEVGPEGLARLTELKSLRYLNLAGSLSYDIDRALAHLAGLTELEELDLRATDVSDAGLAHLKPLTKLKKLHLRSNPATLKITDAGMVHLKELKSLEELDLASPAVTDVGLAHLAQLESLRKVDAYGPGVTDKGLALLAKMKSLEDLDLMSKSITDAGMASLADCASLKVIGLNNCPITDAGFAHLRKLKSLKKLAIVKTKVTGDGLAVLRELPVLTDLTLGFMSLGEAGITGLEGLTSLQRLWLSYPDINIGNHELAILSSLAGLKTLQVNPGSVTKPFTDEGFSHLSNLTALEFLNLGGNKMVTNAGLKALSNLTTLEWLQLDQCDKITNAGLKHLEGLTCLKFLRISDSRVTEAGMGRLKKKIPGLMCHVPPRNPERRGYGDGRGR